MLRQKDAHVRLAASGKGSFCLLLLLLLLLPTMSTLNTTRESLPSVPVRDFSVCTRKPPHHHHHHHTHTQVSVPIQRCRATPSMPINTGGGDVGTVHTLCWLQLEDHVSCPARFSAEVPRTRAPHRHTLHLKRVPTRAWRGTWLVAV